MTQHFDAIVIGAGAMGSAASYYLSKRGQRVLLLEQFDLDHRKGSSYGYSRIIRYCYDRSEYVELAIDNFPLWFAVQEELGEELYVKTGGFDFGPANDDRLQDTLAAIKANNINYEMLSVEEAQYRFPQFRLNADFQVMYQADGGFIKASKAVLGHITLAKARGATVKDRTPVNQIEIKPDNVEVDTGGGSYSAGKLIVTGGAWAKSLLAQTGVSLPLTPLRCQLNFLMPDDITAFDAENCPVWRAHVRDLFSSPVYIYGLPSYDNTGFKIAWHGGQALNHPSETDYSPDEDNIRSLREFMRAHIPGVADAPICDSRICLYTNTPDEHFIIDKHPLHDHIVIGAGFSGHGFKFSTLIGKMLTDIALDGETPHNDKLFKINRFLD